ncbi:MAG: YbaB/EbfC family nucleoid-associated protein [Clostridiaceae bacterium]|nr:YbaB/EbfC family nucleoid-associated protein [Clostridiaceae bacterium]
MARGRGGYPGGGRPRSGGGGNQMDQLMRQAQLMQEELAKAQEETAEMTAESTAGGGVVRALVGGNHQVLELEINPDVVDAEDVEMLQDLISAAINDAMRQLDEKVEARMSQVAGGNINLPGF